MHLIFETLQTVHANFSRRFIEKKKSWVSGNKCTWWNIIFQLLKRKKIRSGSLQRLIPLPLPEKRWSAANTSD